MVSQSSNFLSNSSDLSFNSVAKAKEGAGHRGSKNRIDNTSRAHNDTQQSQQRNDNNTSFFEEYAQVQLREEIVVGEKGNPLPTIQPYFGEELPQIELTEKDGIRLDLEPRLNLDFEQNSPLNLRAASDSSLRSGLAIIPGDNNATYFSESQPKSTLQLNASLLINSSKSGKLNSQSEITSLDTLQWGNKNIQELKVSPEVVALQSKLITQQKAEQFDLKQGILTQLDGEDFITNDSKAKLGSLENGKIAPDLFAQFLKRGDDRLKPNQLSSSHFDIHKLTPLSPPPSSATTSNVDSANPTSSSVLSANSSFQSGLALKNDFTPNLALRIKWVYQQALSSAEILMDPPELGPLSVKLTNTKGETNIVFHVNNPMTKDMIEENLSKLKELLADQNITLGNTQIAQQQKDQNDQKSRDENLTSGSRDLDDDMEDLSNTQERHSRVSLLDTYI